VFPVQDKRKRERRRDRLGRVHPARGITSTGSVCYGTATDIRVILDWPMPFLDGRTIRQLAQESRS
jgi:hypothetical protein